MRNKRRYFDINQKNILEELIWLIEYRIEYASLRNILTKIIKDQDLSDQDASTLNNYLSIGLFDYNHKEIINYIIQNYPRAMPTRVNLNF